MRWYVSCRLAFPSKGSISDLVFARLASQEKVPVNDKYRPTQAIKLDRVRSHLFTFRLPELIRCHTGRNSCESDSTETGLKLSRTVLIATNKFENPETTSPSARVYLCTESVPFFFT